LYVALSIWIRHHKERILNGIVNVTTTINIKFPALSTDKVYLFYADIHDLDNINASRSESWLNDLERKRLKRFFFDRDRKLFKLSHCMLRWVLSNYTGQQPEHLEFDINDYGKPSLKGNADLSFNLSHSNGTSVLAIGNNIELGIDLERVDYQKKNTHDS
jgi:4'-phosphopantetheinyl transferase